MKDVQDELSIVIAGDIHPEPHFVPIWVPNDLRGQEAGLPKHDNTTAPKGHRDPLSTSANGPRATAKFRWTA